MRPKGLLPGVVALAAAILVVWGLMLSPSVGLGELVEALTALSLAGVGATIVVRTGSPLMGWLLLVPGLSTALDLWLRSRYLSMVDNPEFLDFAALAFAQIGWLLVDFPLFTLLAYVFPTGRLLNRWWWLVAGSALVLMVGELALTMVLIDFANAPRPKGLADLAGGALVTNPAGVLTWAEFDAIASHPVTLVLRIVAMTGGPVALAIRYRGGSAVVRAQIKWMLLAASGFAIASSVGGLSGYFSGADVGSWVVWLVEGLTAASAILLPGAIAIAITRYRLFEIDRLVSRTVSYGLVISVLAGVYAGALVLLRSVLPFESEIAVVASTLFVIGLFNPLRRRVQGLIDRRFFRSRYDAVEVVRSFAGRLSGPMDGERLADELEGVLDTTMRPEKVGVWIRGEM